MTSPTQDTSSEAQRVLDNLWRKTTPARKFSLVLDTTRTLQEFLLAWLKARHQGETYNPCYTHGMDPDLRRLNGASVS
jgi:hypothetical protein